jgi:hypothetical protein
MAYLDGMSNEFRELLPDMFEWKTGSVVHDGVGITRMGHPTAPYPSLGSG